MNKKLFLIPMFVIPMLLTSCNEETQTQYDVLTIQPLYTQILDKCSDDSILGFPEGVSKEPDLLIKAATNLSNSLGNVKYKEINKYKDKAIDKILFKDFKPNQIILFQTHGEYDLATHSTMITGNDFDRLPSRLEDIEEGRIIESGMFNSVTAKNYEAITSLYIDEYCPNITGSIVYLGQCYGAYDYALATSFLNKGAVAVIGSTININMHYGDMMQYRIVSLLGEINNKTNNFYTLSEALKKAQNEYGKTDDVKYETAGSGAQVIIYGDPNIRIAKKAN